MPGPIEQAIPHEEVKLSNMRKTIARRLTESKQQVPHIYLTVDIQLDALLKLRGELNAGLESRGVKLSVNDLLIKALAQALIEVPECNVSFAGDHLLKYSRADISVAVSIPAGLITPIIADADNKSVSAISTEMKDLAGRAKDGKLQPQQYQGGTASLSNMGMFGIKQFEAVINPPQGMIMAIGAGEKRPYVINDSLQIATVMSATGSFDHRAIDGADGARLMKAFKGWSKTRWGCWLEMKWLTALLLGAILGIPPADGIRRAQSGVWTDSWASWGTVRPHRRVAGPPVLDSAVPRARRWRFGLFFNWHSAERVNLADRTPLIRVTAMPADTNPYGGVFGGWLMGQMGLACGSFASRRTQRQGDPGRGGRDQISRARWRSATSSASMSSC